MGSVMGWEDDDYTLDTPTPARPVRSSAPGTRRSVPILVPVLSAIQRRLALDLVTHPMWPADARLPPNTPPEWGYCDKPPYEGLPWVYSSDAWVPCLTSNAAGGVLIGMAARYTLGGMPGTLIRLDRHLRDGQPLGEAAARVLLAEWGR